jgi:hypothetical protein
MILLHTVTDAAAAMVGSARVDPFLPLASRQAFGKLLLGAQDRLSDQGRSHWQPAARRRWLFRGSALKHQSSARSPAVRGSLLGLLGAYRSRQAQPSSAHLAALSTAQVAALTTKPRKAWRFLTLARKGLTWISEFSWSGSNPQFLGTAQNAPHCVRGRCVVFLPLTNPVSAAGRALVAWTGRQQRRR